MPNSAQISGRKLYENISEALVYGLRKYDAKLEKVQLENINPNFNNLLKEASGSLCFASTAKSEIKFKGKKLVGSAQRKLGSTILQHGSILVGKYHKKLVDFLNVNENDRLKLETEINEKTTEIESIIEKEVLLQHLQESIINGFIDVLKADFKKNEIRISLV